MDKNPRLNLKHGFLRSIRHRLYKNQSNEAVKESQEIKDVKESSSEPSLAVVGPENTSVDKVRKSRRRPSRQLYRPPHLRDQNQEYEDELHELKSFERRGESEDRMLGVSQKSAGVLPHGPPSGLTGQQQQEYTVQTTVGEGGCGMPLTKSKAKTDLVTASRVKSKESRKACEDEEPVVAGASGDGAGHFGYLLQVFVTDIDFSQIDINGFPEESRRFIFEAYHDPSLVAPGILEGVARVVSERAWTDSREGGYQRTAARLCQRIAKKEYDREEGRAEPSFTFQRGVLDTIYQTFRHRCRLAARSSQQWSAYVVFCSDILRRFHFGKSPPTVLCHLLFSIVERLCSSQCVESVTGVAVLTEVLARGGLLLHAEDEQRLALAVNRLRDKLLHPDTDKRIRLNLLLVLELQASYWTLSPRARRFYLHQ